MTITNSLGIRIYSGEKKNDFAPKKKYTKNGYKYHPSLMEHKKMMDAKKPKEPDWLKKVSD